MIGDLPEKNYTQFLLQRLNLITDQPSGKVEQALRGGGEGGKLSSFSFLSEGRVKIIRFGIDTEVERTTLGGGVV